MYQFMKFSSIRSCIYFVYIFTVSTITGQVLKEDGLNKNQVLGADTIAYFGLDLSKLQLVDPKKVGNEADVIRFFGPWINYIDEYSIRDGALSTLLGKSIYVKKEYVQMLFKKRLAEEFISFTRSPLTLDSIQNMVNAYDLPAVSCNIGLVIVVEAFDKTKESSILNFTFFDVSSRKILWRTKLEGPAGGVGMTKHWGKGAENAVFYFGTHYKRELKTYQKKQKE